MSLEYTKTMLQTLKQYHASEINMIINGNDDKPLLLICFKDGCYELKSLNTSVVEICDDINSTIFTINKLMNVVI